jgi:hypothetical protein
MQLRDVVRCPTCGSADVIYSCEPKCCFNHVCGECRTSFQLVASKTGRFDRDTPVEAQEPASGDPTACCPACESLRLAIVSSTGSDTTLICENCRAVLKLAYEDVAAA